MGRPGGYLYFLSHAVNCKSLAEVPIHHTLRNWSTMDPRVKQILFYWIDFLCHKAMFIIGFHQNLSRTPIASAQKILFRDKRLGCSRQTFWVNDLSACVGWIQVASSLKEFYSILICLITRCYRLSWLLSERMILKCEQQIGERSLNFGGSGTMPGTNSPSLNLTSTSLLALPPKPWMINSAVQCFDCVY